MNWEEHFRECCSCLRTLVLLDIGICLEVAWLPVEHLWYTLDAKSSLERLVTDSINISKVDLAC